MALPNYLANIKSSGIYRFVWDKSEIPGVEEETLRLVVGYSEKGPFNTPVYIQSQSQFKTVFGGISKKLERYGCFFHRLALQALTAGPIIALNIKTFENESVEALSINPEDYIGDILEEIKVNDLYDTNRFWKLEPEHLEDLNNVNDKYIILTHTDSDSVSNTIFMRGYVPSNYNITFKEWYSSVLNGEEMPAYITDGKFELRKLDQYFAEVYVFRGEFTPEICTSENLAKYFIVNGSDIKLQPYLLNAFGEKIDTLDALAQNSTSNFINKYQGILIPEFQSASGSVIALDQVFNSDYDNHKMMMRLNQNMLYNGDIDLEKLNTTGWGDPTAEVKMFSIDGIYPIIAGTTDGDTYTFTQGGEELEGTDYTPTYYDYQGLNLSNGDTENPLTYVTEADTTKMVFTKGDYYIAADNTVATLVDVVYTGEDSVGKAASEYPDKNTQSGTVYEYAGEANFSSNINDKNAEVITVDYKIAVTSPTDAQNAMYDMARMLSAMYHTGNLSKVTYEGDEYTWYPEVGLRGSNYAIKNDDDTYTTLVSVIAAEYSTALPTSLTFLFGEGTDAIKMTINVDSQASEFTPNKRTWEDASADEVYTHKTYLTFDKKIYPEPTEEEPEVDNTHLYKCNASATTTSENMVPTYMEGYTKEHTKPEEKDGFKATSEYAKNYWIDEYILSAFSKYKGLREALTNNVDSEWHYLVDTFQAFVWEECHGKLAIICKEKDNAFGLLNFPRIKSFSSCEYASFRDSNNVFDMKYVAQGCNKVQPHSTVFSLASEDNGASFVGYYTPVVIEENITAIKNVVPSAGLVSNAFMAKYETRYPYSIVAGPNYGVVNYQGLIGPDYNFSRADKDVLEPFGVNVMVYEPRKGTFINSNQTAKQNPVTTLSKINVRELVIFLQDEIEKLLQDYQWEFNTQSLRDTVKNRADVILEKARCNGGVFKYYNQCNEYNNPDDVINNEMLVLSTSIEPGIGCGKMVQEITLYRRGGMTSITK